MLICSKNHLGLQESEILTEIKIAIVFIWSAAN